MKANKSVLSVSVLVVALLAGLSVAQAQSGGQAGDVTAVANIENAAVYADLTGDEAFYQKVLAEDWSRGDSDGTFYTKAQIVALMVNPKNFRTNSERLSELKVRVYGNTAVATYKDTYDMQIMGQRRTHSIIATDTFVRIGGEWKEVASHGAETK